MASKLAQLLNTMGYQQTNGQSRNLEWMFEVEPVQPFLHWLCDNVEGLEENTLSDEEIGQFSLLETSNKIIDGNQLEDALARFTDEYRNVGLYRNYVNRLQIDLENEQQQLGRLNNQRDMITHMLFASVKQLEDLRAYRLDSVKEEQKAYDNAMEMCHYHDRELQALITQAAQLADNISPSSFSSAALSSTSPAYSSPLLYLPSSEAWISLYIQRDNVWTTELANYTNLHFQKGPCCAVLLSPPSESIIVAPRSDQSHGWFNFMKPAPSSLNECTRPAQMYRLFCYELSRLVHIFPISQYQLLLSKMDVTRAHVLLRKLKLLWSSLCCVNADDMEPSDFPSSSSLASLVDTFYQFPSTILYEKCVEWRQQLVHVLEQKTNLLGNQFPSVLRAVSRFYTMSVLQGDYDLKIARQNYVLNRQRFLIFALRSQQARHTLVNSFYDSEKQFLFDVSQLVQSLLVHVQSQHAALIHRLALYEVVRHRNTACYHSIFSSSLSSSFFSSKSDKRLASATVDRSDQLLARLRQLLALDFSSFLSSSPLASRSFFFVTYDELYSRIDHLLTHLRLSQKQIQKQSEQYHRRLSNMMLLCSSLDRLLRPYDSPVHMLSSPSPATKLVFALESKLNRQVAALQKIMCDVISKSETLDVGGKALRTERRVWIDFFLTLQPLKSAIQDLKSRLQPISASNSSSASLISSDRLRQMHVSY
eukprot:TRINITY_DN890_c0_g1_i1.p1 TRINITY_DN890_c0_g1~~TRINITY_DN890_c0_g1_i1.p1  ORF type:complete len:705 (-),score=106.92 TRINITY_DN890_c0_g1_i1:77-2191(-)